MSHEAKPQSDSVGIANLPAYGNGTLPAGIRSRRIAGVNGLTVHILEAGEARRPALLLLHGFPELAANLAKLNPPRKYYQNYQRTPPANADMLYAPQGLAAFFRAYWHYKSADWKGNKPHPLKARTAAEMAQMPTYYVMERDKGMAATVAPFMPSAAEIAQCKWLTEAEVEVYATEYARTQFTGALQGYRVRRGSDPKSIAEMHTFSGRTIDVPSMFIGGKSDERHILLLIRFPLR